MVKDRTALLTDIRAGRYTGAIFDVDGTLLDSMPTWMSLDAKYLLHRGISLNAEEEQALNKAMWKMTIPEGIQYLKTTYALPDSEEDILAGLNELVAEAYIHDVPLKPGTEELLETLQEAGVPMVLATVGDPRLALAALTRLGVAHYFRDTFNATDLGTSKREPLIYHTAAKALGKTGESPTEPQDILVFEDVLHALETAKGAGYTTVLVYDETSRPDYPGIFHYADYFIANTEEELP